tara:strand:+ start:568 stop:1368 length:801 start_codon:yes stop_codon:yes gene_type:complete
MVVDTHFKYLYQVRQVITVALYPIQNLAYIPTTITDLIDDFLVAQNLIDENSRLKQQHLNDSGKMQQFLALKKENAHLRKLLNAIDRNKNKTIMAEINTIPRDPFNLKIIINKGLHNNTQNGQIVIDDLGVIGQITRTYPWSSEATLITDKGHSVPVQVLRNGIRAVAFGTGKYKTLELNYMANNIDIQKGDKLVTSGIGGIYPPGLPVALVSKIMRDVSSSFAVIICKAIAGVDRNRQVLILAPQFNLKNQGNLTDSHFGNKESE